MGEPTFHAGSKLRWIEQVAGDRKATPFHVRIVVAISRRLDGRGVAHVSQETIANFIGATARGVRKAVGDLGRSREKPGGLGHVEITPGGSARGVAATYKPILWERRNAGSALTEPEQSERRNGGSGNSEAQKAERRSTKGGTVVPPLPYKNPFKNPGARAYARDTSASTDPLQVAWQTVKDRLAQPERCGKDKVTAWLDKLVATKQVDDSIILIAPSKFIATYNRTHHADVILNEWRAINPSVSRLRIEWRGSAPGAQQQSDPAPAAGEDCSPREASDRSENGAPKLSHRNEVGR
jgi:hypothetical protein